MTKAGGAGAANDATVILGGGQQNGVPHDDETARAAARQSLVRAVERSRQHLEWAEAALQAFDKES